MKNFPGERREDAERNLMAHFVHGNGSGKQYTAKSQLVSTFLVLRKKNKFPLPCCNLFNSALCQERKVFYA